MIVALMFGLAASVATAQERVTDALRTAAPRVKVWGGRILVMVGLWLVALGIWADAFAGLFPV